MAVTIYKSTDASAPVLTGQVNSLNALLRAILVTGYGAKLAAGWTEPFATSGNVATFRNHATGTNFYLRVDDSGPNVTAGAREAQSRGFEAMTALSTGTQPFPTTSQIGTSGLVVRKSATADAIARPWKAVADNKTLYLFIRPGDFSGWSGFMFGDYFSLKSTVDPYRAMIIGRSTQNSDLDDVDALNRLAVNTTTTAMGNAAITLLGHYVPRGWAENAAQGAILVGKHGDAFKGSVIVAGSALFGQLAGIVTYPNKPDDSIAIAQVWAHEDNGNTVVIRGRLRGFWQQLHPSGATINEGDTWSGTGALVGKTFEVIGPTVDGMGKYVMETSDTWEAN